MKPHVLRIYENADLRCGHVGLKSQMEELEGETSASRLLRRGWVVFLNSKKNQMKLLVTADVVIHFKSPEGKIDLDALSYLPYTLTGDTDIEVAYKRGLEKVLALKEPQRLRAVA